MAARFGATIVPFGTVGEDDIAEVSSAFLTYAFVQLLKMRQIFTFFLLFLPLQLVLDYNDLMKIPFLSNYITEATRDTKEFKLR